MANIVLLIWSKFSPALVLNLLKDFFERSRISFNKFRTSAINKIRVFLIFLILGIRPLFGIAHCRYPVSCTKFAVWQLEEKNLFKALWAIFKRIISCNPLF